jgi:hypothetical protein
VRARRFRTGRAGPSTLLRAPGRRTARSRVCASLTSRGTIASRGCSSSGQRPTTITRDAVSDVDQTPERSVAEPILDRQWQCLVATNVSHLQGSTPTRSRVADATSTVGTGSPDYGAPAALTVGVPMTVKVRCPRSPTPDMICEIGNYWRAGVLAVRRSFGRHVELGRAVKGERLT